MNTLDDLTLWSYLIEELMAKQLKTVPSSSLLIYALSNNPAAMLHPRPLPETTLLSIPYMRPILHLYKPPNAHISPPTRREVEANNQQLSSACNVVQQRTYLHGDFHGWFACALPCLSTPPCRHRPCQSMVQLIPTVLRPLVPEGKGNCAIHRGTGCCPGDQDGSILGQAAFPWLLCQGFCFLFAAVSFTCAVYACFYNDTMMLAEHSSYNEAQQNT